MITELPYLPNLSCGAQLRREVGHLVDYVRVNATAQNTLAADAYHFFDVMVTLVSRKHGDPSDGYYIGVGVPDPRITIYKALSEIRIGIDEGGSGDNLADLQRFTNAVQAILRTLPGKTPIAVATTQLSAEGVIPDKNGQPA